jgi:hypothetical protein
LENYQDQREHSEGVSAKNQRQVPVIFPWLNGLVVEIDLEADEKTQAED